MSGMGWKPPTMIYVARRPDGIRKVGSTMNLPLRLRELAKNYRAPYRCERTWEIPDGMANFIEQCVHDALKKHHFPLGWGSREHYRLPLEEIAEAVERAAKKLGCSTITVKRAMARIKGVDAAAKGRPDAVD